MPRPFTISSLDHLVLTVRSIPRAIDFYTAVLGMKAETFSPPASPSITRHALRFGPQKINLHEQGKEFEPKAKVPTPGSADLCFLTETPLEQALEAVRAKGLQILEGDQIVDRTGARGLIKSFYIRDPDDNLIEISNYVDAK